MATSRPFAYNTGTGITGTTQIGSLAVGYPTEGFTSTGLEWWSGPDEDLGYVIAQPVPSDTQPTNLPEDAITLSSTYKGTDITLSNNNQTASQVFSYSQTTLGETIISETNKVMFSVQYTSTQPSVGVGGHFIGVGITFMNYSGPFNGYPGNDDKSIGFSDDGNYYYNGSSVQSGLPTWTDDDIIDIAISAGQYWWIRVNGGNWNNNPSANPTTLANGSALSLLTNFYPALCPYIYGTMQILNYPKYGVPSDYNFLGNVTASVGFFRSDALSDSSFIKLANIIAGPSGPFTSATGANSWLTNNGYWNSYQVLSPLLSLDAASYSGTGPWIDSVAGKSFTLANSPAWSSNNGGYFNFTPAASQYAICNTSLPSLNTWTVGVWHFYDGASTGSAPCIVTETFVGGGINYSLGRNNGGFSAGFFDGGWRVTDGYTLTPGNWYYIVGTYDGATVKLYVNNTLVDSTAYAGTPTTSGAGIRLMERWDLSDYWGGRLAKVDIYDKALDTNEISSIWDSNKTRFELE